MKATDLILKAFIEIKNYSDMNLEREDRISLLKIINKYLSIINKEKELYNTYELQLMWQKASRLPRANT